MARKIMSWSKCTVECGSTGVNDAMATALTSLGVIKDKSSSLEPGDGESLEAKGTGGELIAKESTDGGYTFKTRVIEPDDELYTRFGLGEVNSSKKELIVKTHVPMGNYSLRVTPKNIGAKGIMAPVCNVAFKPGWSEEEGRYVDVEFEILKSDSNGGYWYSLFTKEATEPAA